MLNKAARACAALLLGGAAMIASAAEVVLYSSNNVDAIGRAVELFNKTHPDIKVSVVRAGTGALMQRMKAEAANPLGDVFWSGGLATVREFRHLLDPYQSAHAAFVPSPYREPSGLWLGTNTQVAVLMVNQRQTGTDPVPARWADLAAPQWKDRIVIPDPERSSASYAALYGLQQLLGADTLGRIARNATVVSTTSAAYEGVAKGEFAVAVTMEYAAQEYVAGGLKEIRVVYPAEGTFASPEGMALIKGGKHPAEARKLYDFLASRELQAQLAKSNYRRPLRSDIDVSQLTGLPALDRLKIVPLDEAKMAAARSEFLAQWRRLLASR